MGVGRCTLQAHYERRGGGGGELLSRRGGGTLHHRLFRQGLETGHVSHTFYGRRLCAVNIIMDSTF